MRLDAEDGSRTAEVPGGYAQFALAPYLEAVGVDWMTLAAYVEHARASGLDPAAAVSPAVAPDAGRATYVAADVGLPALAGGLRAAASWEYKDYQNFALPGGVNEPPTLVREHSIVLLNRGTHEFDETLYLLGDPKPLWLIGQVKRVTDKWERRVRCEDLCVAHMQRLRRPAQPRRASGASTARCRACAGRA